MTPPVKCSVCQIRLHFGFIQKSFGVIQKIAFCPQCEFVFYGPEQEGQLEIEESCFGVRFEWEGQYPSTEEILVVKQLDPDLRHQPTGETFARLKKMTFWQTKGFGRRQCAGIIEAARQQGLKCEGVIVEEETRLRGNVFVIDRWDV
jgi:hypothetical protein